MFFRKSIDHDGAFKQLLVEELVIGQLHFVQNPTTEGDQDWMGFPWCMNLLKLKLRMYGRKGSAEVLGSIVHAGTQLARDIYGRRAEELETARNSKEGVGLKDTEEMAGLFVFMEAMPDVGSFAEAVRLPFMERERLMRRSDEASHRLRVLIVKGGGAASVESRIEAMLAPLSPAERDALAKRVEAKLDLATQRPEKFRFN